MFGIKESEWIKIRHLMNVRLSKIPWLKQKIEKAMWDCKAGTARQKRVKTVPRLLEKYDVKKTENNEPKHIIFLVIDALRKDRMSLYGYQRDTTPFLKSIAPEAAVFENATSASSWTYPSVASILTGMYPHNHGGFHANNPRNFHIENPNKVSQEVVSLPEILAASGFDCYLETAISTSALAIGEWFDSSSVFFAGANLHLNNVVKWLKKNQNRNTLTYLQLGDVHEPINAPEPYRDTFGEIANDIDKLTTWDFRKDGHPGEAAFEKYRDNRGKLYDCALRSVDNQISKFFEFLETSGLRDSSLILITSDHGEEFWDHVELERQRFYDPRPEYGISHGHNLFQELINVPLMAIGPGFTPGVYDQNVSHVDIVPTILKLYGIDHRIPLDGYSLINTPEDRFVLSEATSYGYEKKAVLKDNWKLIDSPGDNISLLYDLSKDTKEQNDLSQTETGKLMELKALLPTTETKGEAIEIDQDIEDQLRNLGYIE